MISSTMTPTRFPQKTAPSDPYLAELLSRCHISATDAHTSPSRIFPPGLPAPEHTRLNRELVIHGGYPSPPSMNPDLGDYISLPPLIDLNSSKPGPGHPGLESRYFGGILDSPLVMYHSFLQSQAPPSPPLTHPTSTSSLPPSETEGYLSSPFSEGHDISDQEDFFNSPPPLLDAFTPSSRSSCSTLQSPPPLSPVSPNSNEWFSHAFPVGCPKDEFGSPHQRSSDDLFGDPDGHFYDRIHSKVDLAQANYPLALLRIQPPEHSDPSPTFSNTLYESPKSIGQDLEPIDFDDNPFPPRPFSPLNPDFERRSHYLQQAPQEVDQSQQHHAGEEMHENSSVHSTFPPTFSPSMRNSSLPDLDDLDVDLDFPIFSEDIKPPPSPSRRFCSDLPHDNHVAPHILPPSYPDTERDELDDTVMLSPPESPGLTLLSLPGADTDEDLISLDLGHPKSSPEPPPLRSQLLIEDDDTTPHSSSSQRSPSPEPCTILDFDLVKPQLADDDEVKRICSLMKRTKDRDRAARQMESLLEGEETVTRSMTDGSSSSTFDAWNRLMEAKRRTRRTKEKVREVATLLRLKLAEKGWQMGKDSFGKPILIPTSPTAPSSSYPLEDDSDAMKVDPQPSPPKGFAQKRQRITNPQQLLVKMVMDRHEPKYNPNLRAGLPSSRISSPLARTSISAADMESYDCEEEEQRTIPDLVAIPDIEMDSVDGDAEDLLDELDLGMEAPVFS